MLSSRNQQKQSDDGASVDHILGSRNSRNSLEVIEMSVGIQDMGTGMGTGTGGIRKQVEVTVVAHDHDHDHDHDRGDNR